MDIREQNVKVNEVHEILEMRKINPRVFREKLDSFYLSNDREFRSKYCLSKTSVRFVIDLVVDRLESYTGREKDLFPAMQILIALRFYVKRMLLIGMRYVIIIN